MAARQPRFRRVAASCKFTARDAEIVRHVARHRFLTSEHIRRLVAGSGQGIVRRLQNLFHAGILDRPRAQLDYFHRAGSKPIVYGLGAKGAKLLHDRGETSSIDWTVKNRNATKLFIEHTLRVADFMTALELACRDADIELIDYPERLRWRVHWRYGDDPAMLGVVPDAAFALARPGSEPVHYCVEVDRATMPVCRRSAHLSSTQRKFFAYHASWQQDILRQHYGWQRFRVLTITTSPARAENLRQVAGELPTGHGLFLFSHFAQFAADKNVLTLPWSGVDAESVATLCDA